MDYLDIAEYHVKIEWSKSALMQFLGNVSPDCYCIILTPTCTYGVIAGTEVMEFLTNKVSFKSLTYVSISEFKSELTKQNKVFGEYA